MTHLQVISEQGLTVRPELVEGWAVKPFMVRQAHHERLNLSLSCFNQVTKQSNHNMFWVYILRCADDSYYTGHTDNLDLRIAQHQSGECGGYTATRRPLALIWSQACPTREEALSAERQIKGWSRKKKEAMMRGDWEEVSRLAKNKSVNSAD